MRPLKIIGIIGADVARKIRTQNRRQIAVIIALYKMCTHHRLPEKFCNVDAAVRNTLALQKLVHCSASQHLIQSVTLWLEPFLFSYQNFKQTSGYSEKLFQALD